MGIELYKHQRDAVDKLQNGNILCGGTGSGKSITSLMYYFETQGGFISGNKYTPMKDNPKDLYIITTAKKRDDLEWEHELTNFLLSTDQSVNYYNNKIVIDSWNNIEKYVNVKNSFFIFDEQRVVGYGKWTKMFLKITKSNNWILLSATPGDTWMDYIPVFIANGFYKNKTDFTDNHVIYDHRVNFPKVDRYLNIERLNRLRRKILVHMDFERHTIPHHEDIFVNYDKVLYKNVTKTRTNPYELIELSDGSTIHAPIQNASKLCQVWRKIINSDESRQLAVLELIEKHPKVIIFYNFDYELDILKNLGYGSNIEVAEWNSHKHQPIPNSKSWVYLVQYNAGSEGWNCINTNTIIFYSENYSYKMMKQAAGRIDRMNTPFTDLYYYHLKSRAPIDLAISRTLKVKKNFSETRYVNKCNLAA